MKTEQEQIKAMTKDEIKKAFAICCGVQDCTGCPILDMEKQNGLGCKFNLFTSVIDIVTEQEKEIERLRTTLGQCNTELNSALESLKSQCREIGELKAGVKQAQIDILNKANERLNVVSRELGDDCDLCGVSAVCSCRCEINNLIKEVQNAEDKS